jgi:hypothetical protein
MRITDRSGARVRCTTPLGAVRLRIEIDQEESLEHEEELVVVLMLVPVILALHDAEPDDRVVHAADRLIPPFVLDRGDHRIERDLGELRKEDVEVGRVRERGWIAACAVRH